jgi:hypothetical protein
MDTNRLLSTVFGNIGPILNAAGLATHRTAGAEPSRLHHAELPIIQRANSAGAWRVPVRAFIRRGIFAEF